MLLSLILVCLLLSFINAHVTGSPTYPSWPDSTKGYPYHGSSIVDFSQTSTFSCSRSVPSNSRSYPLGESATTVALGRACPSIQATFADAGDDVKANAVKDAYVASWNQYSQYCFGQDSFFTNNKSCVNDFGGWGVTIVDALSTAIMMKLTDIVATQLAHIAAIDYTVSTAVQPVNAFETTIRYLGGMLSGYDLLTSGFVESGTYDQTQIDMLLKQAVTLADQLKYRFDTPTGLPAESLFWDNKTYPTEGYLNPINNINYTSSNAAVCGTFILEYYRLSDLTGDTSYREVADRATEYLINFGEYQPIFGNLVGAALDIDTGNYITYDFGWKAGIDSFFEYLLKISIYDPDSNPAYLQFWNKLVGDSQSHIAEHPYNAPQTYLTQADECGVKQHSMDDYACFAGGNILLGSRILTSTEQELESFGLIVTEACYHLYNTTISGLGPQQWAWFDAVNHTYNESWTSNATYIASQQARGYFILDPQYNSFPESIESFWYAYRITGDPMYREWNWNIFQALQDQSDAAQDIVYNGITDVDIPRSFQEELPSFYFAEVLKYLYLSFTDPSVISLDEWVFNTEAHPLRISGGCIRQ